MSSGQSNPKTPPPLAAATSGEAKARGANRSTKVAGKLKVLPEHAEPVLEKGKVQPPSAPPTSKADETGEGSGTLADSEDEDGDEEEEPDDAEVCRVSHPPSARASCLDSHRVACLPPSCYCHFTT